MGERVTVRLGDVADISWGDTTTTKASYVERGERAFSASGPDGFLDHADYSQTGIVVSAIGANCGRSWLARGEWSCIKNTIRILSTDERLDIEYLFWLLQEENRWPQRGSAQPFISQTDARNVRVALPPLSEQQAIAEVLGALDDKIEANRRVTAIAEGLARCLFADAVATFGEDNANLSRLDALVEHLPGKYLSRDEYAKAGHYKVYGSNSVMGSHDAYLYDGPFTVMARIGSNCGALMWSGPPAWVNNNASALRAKPGVDPWFLHRLLETIDMDQHRGGSGQPFIRVESLLSTVVMVPDARQQSFAGVKLRALAELAHGADRESMSLSALRDALLPRLLSGELRVRAAEELVKEAV